MSIISRIGSTAAIVVAIVATASLAPSSAVAQDGPVTIYGESTMSRTERVSFAKLDLGHARDQRRLRSRVGAAVERVCLRDIGRDGLQDRDYYACEKKAWDDAVPQIDSAIARSASLALGEAAPLTAIRVSAR